MTTIEGRFLLQHRLGLGQRLFKEKKNIFMVYYPKVKTNNFIRDIGGITYKICFLVKTQNKCGKGQGVWAKIKKQNEVKRF